MTWPSRVTRHPARLNIIAYPQTEGNQPDADRGCVHQNPFRERQTREVLEVAHSWKRRFPRAVVSYEYEVHGGFFWGDRD